MKYQGIVVDRLNTLDDRKTKLYSTYKEAHKAAENLCKRTMGERGSISVKEVARPRLNTYKVESIDHLNGEYLPGTEVELYLGKDQEAARAVFDKFLETETTTAIGSKLEDDGRWEIIWE